MSWVHHQEFEQSWWGNCINTFGEEAKQITYAHRMGLYCINHNGHWPCYDMQGKSVIDLGGGPASMMLKTINASHLSVVDPCVYPEWVYVRYQAAGIDYYRSPAEEYVPKRHFDECWIYNVLQHVQDPQKIIENAKKYSRVIRLFEWIDLEPHLGHPHELKEARLNSWLGSSGTVEALNGENNCHGKAYYGSFKCGSTF